MSNQIREYVLIADPKVTITLKPVDDGEHSLYVMESGPEWLKTVVWNEDGVVIENKTDRGDIEVVEKNKLRQYEIPVRDVLALMKEGKTAYYTCYNAAMCMIPYFETHHYEMWAKHKEHFFKAAERNEDSHLDIHSGYYAYYFITKNFMGDTFENSIINQLCEWQKDVYRMSIRLKLDSDEFECNSFPDLLRFADLKGIKHRQLRVQLMEHALKLNPDATFKVVF